MILLKVLVIAAVMFLIGFLVGVKNEPPIGKISHKPKYEKQLPDIQKELENFLNYDGNAQQ